MTDRGLVRAAAFRSLWQSLVDVVGPEGIALLERAGLAADLPAEAMMAFDAGTEMLEEASRVSGRGDIAVTLARRLPWSDVGVLGYVILHAPTLGVALTHLRRYFAIQQRAGEWTLEVDADTARLRYALRQPPHEPPRQHVLLLFTMIIRLVREGIGDMAWAPAEVRLPLSPPTLRSEALSYYGVSIEYDADVAEVVFPAATLRRAMITADPGLFPILVHHADECLAKLPAVEDSELDRVRRLVASLLGNGDLSIEIVAARVGTSARTLQRQLQTNGVSFKELVDEVRLGMARRHLAEPERNLTDTAFLLGYSDLSAFSRAFRRWTGQSPQEYRRTQMATA